MLVARGDLDEQSTYLLSLAHFFCELYRMAKPLTDFVRLLTALIAWLAIIALAPCPVAHGQLGSEARAVESQTAPTVPNAADAPSVIEPLPTTEDRLRTIENQLQKLLDVDEGKVEVPTPRPSFQIGGQLNIDYLFIGQSAANRASVGDADDTFDFRRARLTGRGEAFEVVEYSIGFDFALAGRPSFLDNWIAVRDLPLLGNVRVGHYFEPFSLERYTQVRKRVG